MKGDYYRYLAEVAISDARAAILDDSQKAYQEALVIAKSNMQPTHPLRLGLVISHSTLLYEALERPIDAISLADKSLEEAWSICDHSSEVEAGALMDKLHELTSCWSEKVG